MCIAIDGKSGEFIEGKLCTFFFGTGYPDVFIELKDNKVVPGFGQTQKYIILFLS